MNLLFSFVECYPVKHGSSSLVFSLKSIQVINVIIVTLALHAWSADGGSSPCSWWANPEPAPDVALVLFKAEQTDSSKYLQRIIFVTVFNNNDSNAFSQITGALL